jgi:hypothetical protein
MSHHLFAILIQRLHLLPSDAHLLQWCSRQREGKSVRSMHRWTWAEIIRR